MRKEDVAKHRVCVQYDHHPRLMCAVLCSLMEHQSLVDLAIRCGNNTMHAHKCILAASSPYFREQLEKNPGTEQVIINGIDFAAMKSVIEFIYCGETNILEEHLKTVIAAAKLFQIRGLQAIGSEALFESEEMMIIPPPIFINKKPKYSSAYIPYVPIAQQTSPNEKNLLPFDPNYRRMKRKFVRTAIEAEKACAREARASRLALEALKKELGPANQMHNYEIRDNCTETTVENFITSTDDDSFMNDLEAIPMQVVNYGDLNLTTPVLSSGQVINLSKGLSNNLIPFEISGGEKTVDKIKDVFSQEMQTNVEIMYKTPEGEFVKVTDEVLRNITGDTLQFQVIDENGREGEIQLLDDKIKMKTEVSEKTTQKFEETVREFINTSFSDDNGNQNDLDSILLNLQEIEGNSDKVKSGDGKLEKIIADLKETEENKICGMSEDPEEHEHTDILNEINSMQYYDKSVYEDVADQVESAFQRKEEDNDKEKDIEVVDVSPSKSPRICDMVDENAVDNSPKYSPRKTRSSSLGSQIVSKKK